jgi:hypothetical protein
LEPSNLLLEEVVLFFRIDQKEIVTEDAPEPLADRGRYDLKGRGDLQEEGVPPLPHRARPR